MRKMIYRVNDRVRILHPSPRHGDHGFIVIVDDTARDPYTVQFEDGSTFSYAGDEITFDVAATGDNLINAVAELAYDPHIGPAMTEAIEARVKDSFEHYQKRTRDHAIYPKEWAISYLALGIASEAGEVAGKVKKGIRDNVVNKEGLLADLRLCSLWITL